MTYTQDSPIPTMTSSEHHISLRNRKRMDVTAVKAMERFDTEEFGAFMICWRKWQVGCSTDTNCIVHCDR